MSQNPHEVLYRGSAVLERLERCPIVVCGAGALGANLAVSLARIGAKSLTVIDRDRIEERNLATQPFQRSDVGRFKAKTLVGDIYRATGSQAKAISEELTPDNAAKLFSGAELVVDAFDNSVARRAVRDTAASASIPSLHAGMGDGYSEVVWGERYRVPSNVNDDVCDYPLARSLVLLTATITGEVILRWLDDGRRESYATTLGDLRINSL